MTLGPRILIIGNSGAGKSTLARELAESSAVPTIDLDRVHWLDKVGVKRDEDQAKAMAAAIAAKPCWIVEGVYGWLAEVVLPRATSLIWLDMPWSVCREGLARRGAWHGATTDEYAALLAWAEAYWTRPTSSSLGGHLALFTTFDGVKRRLIARSDVAELVAKSSV